MGIIRYRIGLINDFRKTWAVVSFIDYGEAQFWDSWCIKELVLKKQHPRDSIGVFLNFEKIGDFKNNEEAENLLKRLISEAPKEAKFEEFINVFAKAMGK